MSTNNEFYVNEVFYPTVMIDPASEEFKNTKPLAQHLLKTKRKRGPGKGQVRGAYYDAVAQVLKRKY